MRKYTDQKFKYLKQQFKTKSTHSEDRHAKHYSALPTHVSKLTKYIVKSRQDPYAKPENSKLFFE